MLTSRCSFCTRSTASRRAVVVQSHSLYVNSYPLTLQRNELDHMAQGKRQFGFGVISDIQVRDAMQVHAMMHGARGLGS